MILASGSPRRRELLAGGGVEPRVVPADVDEAALPGEDARMLVRRLAHDKAVAVARTHPGRVVLGADTVVERHDDGGPVVLGKPADTAAAAAMLRASSGARLLVRTGVAVVGPDGDVEVVDEATALRMHDYDPPTIAAYVTTGEPLDAAGGFRIQGRGARLVAARDGCFTNVVGLPTCRAATLLARHGVALVPDGCPDAPA